MNKKRAVSIGSHDTNPHLQISASVSGSAAKRWTTFTPDSDTLMGQPLFDLECIRLVLFVILINKQFRNEFKVT